MRVRRKEVEEDWRPREERSWIVLVGVGCWDCWASAWARSSDPVS